MGIQENDPLLMKDDCCSAKTELMKTSGSSFAPITYLAAIIQCENTIRNKEEQMRLFSNVEA